MVVIAPSILSADFSRLAEEIHCVEQGGAQYLHLDIMDGHFVPNITIGPQVVAALRPCSGLVFDVHLMIEDPEKYIQAFAQAGADIITVHSESTRHLHRVLQNIRELGCRCGVAINPGTPVASLECVLRDIDMVLIMSVNPGFGGQEFIPYSVTKVSQAREILQKQNPNHHVHIEVDGGINLETAPLVVAQGADVLVAGSSVFKSEDPGLMVQKLKNCAV